MGYVAGIGGANVDIHGKGLAPVILRDSNPGMLHTSVGGVCRNVLDNLTRLGIATKLASVVGDDDYGAILRASCQRLGIDDSHVFTRPGAHSSCYISIMDSAGDMLVAMSDMRIIKEMDAGFVDSCLAMLEEADLVVCDGNLGAEALERLTQRCTRPLYLDPVSTTWAKNLLPFLGAFDTIKPNRMEMEVLAGMAINSEADLKEACRRVRERGVRRCFVSLGAGGLYYQGPEGEARGKSHDFTQMTNATGAGDATMAGIVYAAEKGLSPEETLRFALGSGLVAVSGPDTIHEAMSASAVEAMIKEYVL